MDLKKIKKIRNLEVITIVVSGILILGIWIISYYLDLIFSQNWYLYALIYLFVGVLLFFSLKYKHVQDLELLGLIFSSILFVIVTSILLYSYNDSRKYESGVKKCEDISGISLSSMDIRYKNNPEADPYTYLSLQFEKGSIAFEEISDSLERNNLPGDRPWMENFDAAFYTYLIVDYQKLVNNSNYYILTYQKEGEEELTYNALPSESGMYEFTYIFFNSNNYSLIYLSYDVYIK